MVQTDDLKRVLNAANKARSDFGLNRTLVIFDLDNTLLAMEQDLGSDQWYDWQKNLQASDPCDENLVADRLAVQGALYWASAMRLTQPDAADIVKAIQDLGVEVIAITSRGPDFRLSTFRELRRNSIDFDDSDLQTDTPFEGPFQPQDADRPVLYEDGVLFVAGQHKGEMLMALLKKLDLNAPRGIVVADDKVDNLEAYRETALDKGISLRAFHYTGEEDTIEHFSGEHAEAQWERLWQSLVTIQEEFGTDHFDIPGVNRPENCLLPEPESSD